MTDRPSRIENQLDVVGRTMSQAPSAIMEELYSDVTQRPGQVIQNSAIAGAIGYGATILMRRAPLAGALVAGTALLAEGWRVAPKVSSFLDEAGEADTREKRIAVARQGVRGLSREGALFIETLPAAGLGSKLAFATLEKSAFAHNLSTAIAEKAEFPLRRALPDELFFKGPGTKIKTNLMADSQTVDALGASRLMPSQKPYTVEHGRIIDPIRGRMSHVMSGTAESVEIGVVQQPRQIQIHTHNPHVDAPGMMSVPDMRMTPKDALGIINAGENQTFYMGLGKAPVAPGSEVQVRALVLDHKTKEAFLHDYVAMADRKTFGLSGLKDPLKVDYDGALHSLQRVDINNPWNTLSRIAPYEKPGVSTLAETLGLNRVNNSFSSRLSSRLGIGDGLPTFIRSTVTASNPLFLADRSKS
ncbi:MAG: hypothetical protein K2Y39_22680 [Candidatus Obscuribacterales bacterium]|nr:hypothetical protein [Candidatus Obscuribacterales bacterium]